MKLPIKLAPDVFAEAVARAKAGLVKPKKQYRDKRTTPPNVGRPKSDTEQAAQLNLNSNAADRRTQ